MEDLPSYFHVYSSPGGLIVPLDIRVQGHLVCFPSPFPVPKQHCEFYPLEENVNDACSVRFGTHKKIFFNRNHMLSSFIKNRIQIWKQMKSY